MMIGRRGTVKFEQLFPEYEQLDLSDQAHAFAYFFGFVEAYFDDMNKESISKEQLFDYVKKAIEESNK
jgi:hypothetical protein